MEEFFGDEQKSLFWEKVDARAKLFLVVLLLGIVVSARNFCAPAACCLFMLLLLSFQVPLPLLLRRQLPVLLMAFFLFVTQVFWYGTTPLFNLGWGGAALTGYREGIERGVLLAARVLGGFSLLLFLNTTTQVKDLLAAARWFRVPPPCLEVAVSAYRAVHLLAEEIPLVYRAQRLRLNYVGWRRGLRSIGMLGGIVLTRALDRGEALARALESRGCRELWPGAPGEGRGAAGATLLVLGLGACLGLALILLGFCQPSPGPGPCRIF